jgi:hypothetical protein
MNNSKKVLISCEYVVMLLKIKKLIKSGEGNWPDETRQPAMQQGANSSRMCSHFGR